MAGKIYNLYLKLVNSSALQDEVWKLWCKEEKTIFEKEEIVIGSILTQRTSWRNVEMAINNLKKEKICSLKSIFLIGQKIEKLEILLRPAGFYRQKARRLFELSRLITLNYGLQNFFKKSFVTARTELLLQKGIGPETADTILLYAGNWPIFVIDEYTRRFVRRNNLANDLNYDFLQRLFQTNLPESVKIYRDFHALIVQSEKKR